MKKIIPFNNTLEFDTDVCEITAISLEHKIDTIDDMISGKFYISGEYKITDGQLEREKFQFELPFSIALSDNYDMDSLVIDIDDFRYELILNNKLKVNIDLYIEGDVKEEPVQMDIVSKDIIEVDNNETLIQTNEVKEEDVSSKLSEVVEKEKEPDDLKERVNLLDDMLEQQEENSTKENSNINLFDSITSEEKFVTYRVYRITDGDTLDNIIEKYNTSKEELEKYNDIVDIKIGDKLIIPANDK